MIDFVNKYSLSSNPTNLTEWKEQLTKLRMKLQHETIGYLNTQLMLKYGIKTWKEYINNKNDLLKRLKYILSQNEEEEEKK